MGKVIGIKKGVVYDFVDRNTGNKIHTEGINLYIGEERKDVDGICFEKPLFVSNTKPYFGLADSLKVGDIVTVYYNKFGKVDSIMK